MNNTNLKLRPFEALTVTEAMYNRRAVKHFDVNYKISRDDVYEIIKTAKLTPTAYNLQHFRVLWVEDESLRNQIKEAAYNQKQITDASVLLLIYMFKNAWENFPINFWPNTSVEVNKKIQTSIRRYYSGNIRRQRDEAVRSCSLFAMSAMLLAQEKGIDTCPIGGFDENKVSQIVGLPSDYEVSIMLTMGKCLRPPEPRSGKLSISQLMRIDRF